MSDSTLTLASSSTGSTKDSPVMPCPCTEPRTFLIFHGSPGDGSRLFEMAAQTHKKYIEDNGYIVKDKKGGEKKEKNNYAPGLAEYRKDCGDIVKIIKSFKGSQIKEALAKHTNIISISYFGHSYTLGLSLGDSIDFADKNPEIWLTTERIAEAWYDTVNSPENYVDEVVRMHEDLISDADDIKTFTPKWEKLAPDWTEDIDKNPTLKSNKDELEKAKRERIELLKNMNYHVRNLPIDNVLPGATIHIFGCNAGLLIDDKQKYKMHPHEKLGLDGIAQQLANHFQRDTYGFISGAGFHKDWKIGLGKEIMPQSDRNIDVRIQYSADAGVWLAPYDGKAPTVYSPTI